MSGIFGMMCRGSAPRRFRLVKSALAKYKTWRSADRIGPGCASARGVSGSMRRAFDSHAAQATGAVRPAGALLLGTILLLTGP
jgi:hypothetical protein